MAQTDYHTWIFNVDDFPLTDPGYDFFKNSDRPTFEIGSTFSFATVGEAQPITISDDNNSLTDNDSPTDSNIQFINFSDPDQTVTVKGGQVWGNDTQLETAWQVSLSGSDGSSLTVWGVTFNQHDNDVQAFVTTADLKTGVTYTITAYSTNSGAGYASLVCFVGGTLIETPDGPRPVEGLGKGDLVLTNSGAARPIRWIGARHVTAAQMQHDSRLKPIRIGQGALAPGVPRRDLLVSPQHRILLRSAIARTMFGTDEVLAPAVHLLAAPGIERVETPGDLSYHHIMLDSHDILLSEGAETESLLPGPVALAGLSSAARIEIITLFPELATMVMPAARPIPAGGRTRRLVERHIRNNKPLSGARL
ncbi:MAG: Hint domain-containing protein [Paracoccus sp. (in: a-proteobacteria)]|uniref:Hint domain-containing protein n=1 Tax=Paracoccus sp. TaxID=267 RepID=UPI0026DEDCC8|nr:Hint domain-containing protein [Paracoccus sp. (in: a-proteobacteria)]MDO5631414.1 Hint domain-containing protein [Paracoccus sp. (in: a-proteobacteria)]